MSAFGGRHAHGGSSTACGERTPSGYPGTEKYARRQKAQTSHNHRLGRSRRTVGHP